MRILRFFLFYILVIMLLHDLEFAPYISKEKINNRIIQLAEKIDADFKNEEIYFVAVLNGSFIFAADLLKEVKALSYINFIRVFSYQGVSSEGKVNELMGLNESLTGKNVIIVEDIIDTGLTIQYIYQSIASHQPKQIKIASLLLKKDVYNGSLPVDYTGFEIDNKFVVGYGLDYKGLGRNIPEILIKK